MDGIGCQQNQHRLRLPDQGGGVALPELPELFSVRLVSLASLSQTQTQTHTQTQIHTQRTQAEATVTKTGNDHARRSRAPPREADGATY